MNSRLIPLVWLTLLVYLAIGQGGCNRKHKVAQPASPALGPVVDVETDESDSKETRDAIRREFVAVAERLEKSDNQYLGREQIDKIRKQLNASPGFPAKVNHLLQLSWHHLRLGDLDESEAAIAQAFGVVTESGHAVQGPMLKFRALVKIREAETRNCIEQHHPQCCVFPLAGKGVHSEKEPMSKARSYLLQLLALEPHNIEAAWLLNITSMATGDFPNDIPEHIRLPLDLSQDHTIPRFRDVAGELGVDTFNLCGGAIVDDFNNDGQLDILTSTYDPRGSLTFYLNDAGQFRDATKLSQLQDQLGGLNCLAADYDNDGDRDVLVVRGAWLGDDGQIRNSLLQNDGRGVFADVTKVAGLDVVVAPTQAATWGDFDGDGFLDLYVGNESRVEFEPGEGDYPSQLFRNNRDGTFTDVAVEAGVTNDRYCKGVSAGDFDNDGDLDVYVSNQGANRLYRNDGNLHFTDIAREARVLEPRQQSFATWFFDYDNDGWLDLFVAAYESTNSDVAADYFGLPHKGIAPCLYRNRRDGTFANVTDDVGLNHAYLPMGANFGDIDNDGFLDVYLATGRPDFAALMPNVMLRNEAGLRFRDITFASGLGHLQKGHGVAFADFDNDGDQDIYHQLGGFFPSDKFHNALFLNPGNTNSMIVLSLTGTTSNRDAVGARIRVDGTSSEGTLQVFRSVGAVSSFGGSPQRQEIGLGSSTKVDQIVIDWPRSGRHVVRDVPVGVHIHVTEGQSKYELEQLDSSK